MALNPPPIQEKTTDSMGVFPTVWIKWFSSVLKILTGKEPFKLASYVVASPPNATLFTGYIIYISNETGGAVPAFSDGVNWRRVTDRAIIS